MHPELTWEKAFKDPNITIIPEYLGVVPEMQYCLWSEKQHNNTKQ